MKESDAAGLEAFARHLQASGRAERTVAGYRRDLSLFARWFEATNGRPLEPGLLTSTDAREYRGYLVAVRRAKPATVNRRLAALRAYAAWARQEGHITLDPLERVRGVAEQETAPRWLTRGERQALLRELETAVNGATTQAWARQAVRDRALVLLLLHTGLRVGELCALELDDLTLSERKGQVRVRLGKGAKARTVPLNAEARRPLRAWLEARGEVDSGMLFVGKGGRGLQPGGVQRRLSALGRRAGVELTPHTLRHTFAKSLIDAGVTLEKVAALLGHSNLNTTRIYVAPAQADLERAVAALEE